MRLPAGTTMDRSFRKAKATATWVQVTPVASRSPSRVNLPSASASGAGDLGEGIERAAVLVGLAACGDHGADQAAAGVNEEGLGAGGGHGHSRPLPGHEDPALVLLEPGLLLHERTHSTVQAGREPQHPPPGQAGTRRPQDARGVHAWTQSPPEGQPSGGDCLESARNSPAGSEWRRYLVAPAPRRHRVA
jgi:hypothetical protein